MKEPTKGLSTETQLTLVAFSLTQHPHTTVPSPCPSEIPAFPRGRPHRAPTSHQEHGDRRISKIRQEKFPKALIGKGHAGVKFYIRRGKAGAAGTTSAGGCRAELSAHRGLAPLTRALRAPGPSHRSSPGGCARPQQRQPPPAGSAVPGVSSPAAGTNPSPAEAIRSRAGWAPRVPRPRAGPRTQTPLGSSHPSELTFVFPQKSHRHRRGWGVIVSSKHSSALRATRTPPAPPSRRDPDAPQHLQRPGRHPATPATGSPRHPRPGPPRSWRVPSPRAGNRPHVPAAPRPPRRRVSPARPWAGPDGAECWGSGGGTAGHGPSSCQRKREEGLGPALPSGEELGALPRGGSSLAEEGREGWRKGALPAPFSSAPHPLHPAPAGALGRAVPGAHPAPWGGCQEHSPGAPSRSWRDAPGRGAPTAPPSCPLPRGTRGWTAPPGSGRRGWCPCPQAAVSAALTAAANGEAGLRCSAVRSPSRLPVRCCGF